MGKTWRRGATLKDLYIFGAGQFAEVARFYFEKDGAYRVKSFLVDAERMSTSSFVGVDVVPLEEIAELSLSIDSCFFVAVGYSGMNEARRQKMDYLLDLGLSPASYVSPDASLYTNQDFSRVRHLFILEGNVIQYGSTIGDNVVLWSGNHIGHHSSIGENSFISSHVVISANASIGVGSFLGVNSSVADGVSIGAKSFVSAGTVVTQNVDQGSLVSRGSQQHVIDNGARFV